MTWRTQLRSRGMFRETRPVPVYVRRGLARPLVWKPRQGRCQADIRGGDLRDAEGGQRLLSKLVLEQPRGRLVAVLLADEAVHMGDDEVNRLLREPVERGAFPEDFPEVPPGFHSMCKVRTELPVNTVLWAMSATVWSQKSPLRLV